MAGQRVVQPLEWHSQLHLRMCCFPGRVIFVSHSFDCPSLQGGECMQPFMAWGLDKGVLKRIWDLVAGTAAQLSQAQFTQAVYLMDAAKRGLPLPPALPPGQFPLLAGGGGGPGSSGGAAPPVSIRGGSGGGEAGCHLYDELLTHRCCIGGLIHVEHMLIPVAGVACCPHT
jgi:hypothetical protein